MRRRPKPSPVVTVLSPVMGGAVTVLVAVLIFVGDWNLKQQVGGLFLAGVLGVGVTLLCGRVLRGD